MQKIILVALGSALIAIPRLSHAQSACLPPDTVAIPSIKARLIDLVTSTDTETVRIRNAYNLPSLNANAVALVTTEATCLKAANALAAITPGGDAAPGAYVFKMGSTRFVAFNGRQKVHGSAYAYVYDKNFVRLASFTF